jgi:hypothetical protein
MSKTFLRLLLAAFVLMFLTTAPTADPSKQPSEISFSDRWIEFETPDLRTPDAQMPEVSAPVTIEVEQCSDEQSCADRDLWVFYQRSRKIDNTGDFAWKDIAAAERSHRTLEDQVIRGMDPNFRILVASALRKLEEAGFNPCITSAFRDDFRQSLIHAGMHALVGYSFHGGSMHGGYGHGVAIDLVSCSGATNDEHYDASKKLWKYIDVHMTELGIRRPLGDRDPPHMAPIYGEEWEFRRLVAARRAESARQVNVHQLPKLPHHAEHFSRKHAHG